MRAAKTSAAERDMAGGIEPATLVPIQFAKPFEAQPDALMPNDLTHTDLISTNQTATPPARALQTGADNATAAAPQLPPMLPAIRIRRALALAQAEDAAALYWQAFGRQILPLPVRAAKGQALLRRCLHPYRAISAQVDGALIGLIGLRDAKGGLFGPRPQDIRAVWGGPYGRALAAASGLYKGGPDSDELVIDGIVVAPAWRGRGIGAALVRAAMTEAETRDFPGLRAEVAPGNLAGLALYQSLGFSQIGQARIGWPWSRGQSSRALIMRLALQPPQGCPPSP